MTYIICAESELTLSQRQVLRSIYKVERLHPLPQVTNQFHFDRQAMDHAQVQCMQNLLNELGPKTTIKKYATQGNNLSTHG